MPRISQEQKLKAEQERLRILTNKNKVRLMDLLFRIDRMQSENIGKASEISYTLLQDARVSTFTHTACPGVSFTYPIEVTESWNSSSNYKKWDSSTDTIRFDNDESDEYKFDNITEALDKLEALDKEEREKKARKDAMLRRMTPEQRADLGFENWRDPNPDGAAEVLAEKVVAAKKRRRK